jgi:hypothetical protein
VYLMAGGKRGAFRPIGMACAYGFRCLMLAMT